MLLPDLKKNSSQKGFTLIELIIVIGILGVLLSIVLVAINPARQFGQANDVQRRSDVNTILNAIHQFAADHHGVLPAGITTSIADIKSAAGGANICSDLVDTYIASLPYDPTKGSFTSCSTYDTSYTVVKSATNSRVTVSATADTAGTTIMVTR